MSAPVQYGRVLVTGGAGFVGSHLVDTLTNDGVEVRVLDNLSTGQSDYLKPLMGTDKMQFIEGDLRDEGKVKAAVKDVEAVFHLAAITSVPYSVQYPEVTRQVNVEGTRTVLEACLREGVEQVINVSSCAVYGEPKYLPVDEGHPTNPISPYAETKLAAEQLCREFREASGLKTMVLRPFNMYGSRMRKDQYGGVIARFAEQLRVQKPPIIYGDGEQTRDFLHVEDAVRAMRLVLGRNQAVGRTLNIASGSPTSINQLAGLMTRLFGASGVKPQYRQARAGDIQQSYANIEAAKTVLGFQPRLDITAGLQQTFKQILAE